MESKKYTQRSQNRDNDSPKTEDPRLDLINGEGNSCRNYYLLKNLEVVSDSEYWASFRKEGVNQSPPLKSSANKMALVELAKKFQDERRVGQNS